MDIIGMLLVLLNRSAYGADSLQQTIRVTHESTTIPCPGPGEGRLDKCYQKLRGWGGDA